MDSHFGSRFKELRMGIGLTQADMAVKLCVSKSTISLWERGSVIPHYSEIVKAAECFGVSQAYILGIDSENKTVSNSQIVELAYAVSSLNAKTQKMACDFLRYLLKQEEDVAVNTSAADDFKALEG